jgi:hypothetical protein
MRHQTTSETKKPGYGSAELPLSKRPTLLYLVFTSPEIVTESNGGNEADEALNGKNIIAHIIANKYRISLLL